MEPTDRVVVYSDGVTEARSPDGNFLGAGKLVDLLTSNLGSGVNAPEAVRRVVRSLLEHRQGRLDDDATLLLAEWRPRDQSALLP